MAVIRRTLLKSPPELWAILDDPSLMRLWLSQMIGEPVEQVNVICREEGCALSFVPADRSDGVRGAQIDISLEETAFGTRVRVGSSFKAEGWIPSARRYAEEQAEARMSTLLDTAIEEMATPQKRPFTAA